jgi:hypothetical protein
MLDTQGLVALWREGLGAQKALLYYEQGMKFGYQNHPQLQRFKNSDDPMNAMAFYMQGVYEESKARGYKFNSTLLLPVHDGVAPAIAVTEGQVEYEHSWLLKKLEARSPQTLPHAQDVRLHPLFFEIPGNIESWEKIPKEDGLS